MRHAWQIVTVCSQGRDGVVHRADARVVVVLGDDGRPVAAWLPWWGRWAETQGAVPVGSS